MSVTTTAADVAGNICHAGWLVCLDAHEGAGTWAASFATLAAVVVALMLPVIADRSERRRRRDAFFAYIGHAHALAQMYFNNNDTAAEGATVETQAARILLRSALQATEDAIGLQFLSDDLMIGALNMRTSLSFMLLDLERAAGAAPHVLVGALKVGYAPMRPDIEKWRGRLRALGADVGSDNIAGDESHILRS
jgi:hypothetical protein